VQAQQQVQQQAQQQLLQAQLLQLPAKPRRRQAGSK
jgi:hypothetical protein